MGALLTWVNIAVVVVCIALVALLISDGAMPSRNECVCPAPSAPEGSKR